MSLHFAPRVLGTLCEHREPKHLEDTWLATDYAPPSQVLYFHRDRQNRRDNSGEIKLNR